MEVVMGCRSQAKAVKAWKVVKGYRHIVCHGRAVCWGTLQLNGNAVTWAWIAKGEEGQSWVSVFMVEGLGTVGCGLMKVVTRCEVGSYLHVYFRIPNGRGLKNSASSQSQWVATIQRQILLEEKVPYTGQCFVPYPLPLWPICVVHVAR